MSVYIKGMKMPQSCNACMFDVYGLCLINKNLEGEDELTHSCPLIPVPPHGRLIDADEFLKRAFGTKCFRGDYALMLEELVGESSTIIEAEGGET